MHKEYLEENGLSLSGQSGVRSHHSCESAKQCICTDCRNSDGEVIISVLVDLERAFETIDRGILLKKKLTTRPIEK